MRKLGLTGGSNLPNVTKMRTEFMVESSRLSGEQPTNVLFKHECAHESPEESIKMLVLI